MAHPILVGGTGRSGTTIVGGLVAAHREVAGVPFEVKIHLLPGYVARGRDLDWVRDQAWRRRSSHLYDLHDDASFSELLEGYLRGASHSPDAPRAYIDALMRPAVERAGKRTWVEMTPANAMWGSWFQRMFPEMRLLHVLRDGRDVAASTSASWGQMTNDEALQWWAMRVEQIARDMRQIEEEVALTIRFEELARDNRDSTYGRILDFLGLPDDEAMREFFDTKVRPERANIGRWERGLSAREKRVFTGAYKRFLGQHREQGIDWVPLPEDVH